MLLLSSFHVLANNPGLVNAEGPFDLEDVIMQLIPYGPRLGDMQGASLRHG